jgi:hypothetical protein
MAQTGRKSRPPTAARRVGYLIAAGINGVLLYLINVSPGWQAIPFLTENTNQVLGLINISIVVGLAANVSYLVYDAHGWKTAGDLLVTGIGVIVLFRLWTVFPFDFASSSVNWPFLARLLLVVAMVGAAIGMATQLSSLFDRAGGSDDDRPEKHLGSSIRSARGPRAETQATHGTDPRRHDD